MSGPRPNHVYRHAVSSPRPRQPSGLRPPTPQPFQPPSSTGTPPRSRLVSGPGSPRPGTPFPRIVGAPSGGFSTPHPLPPNVPSRWDKIAELIFFFNNLSDQDPCTENCTAPTEASIFLRNSKTCITASSFSSRYISRSILKLNQRPKSICSFILWNFIY